jgi:hypothetical protein
MGISILGNSPYIKIIQLWNPLKEISGDFSIMRTVSRGNYATTPEFLNLGYQKGEEEQLETRI